LATLRPVIAEGALQSSHFVAARRMEDRGHFIQACPESNRRGQRMKFGLALACFAIAAASGTIAHAQSGPLRAVKAVPFVATDWSGFYVGAHLGGSFGTDRVDNPYGPSVYGGAVRMPKALAGVQAGYNWQAAGSPWMIGIEADVSALDADGTNTCLAYSGQFVSANCRARQHAMGSIAGRLGRAFGPHGRSLAYIKGGAAFLDSDVSITTNAEDYLLQPSSEARGVRWGWTVGVGLEQRLSPAWSIKAEYDYARFGHRGITAPGGGVLATLFDPASLVNTAGLPTRVSADAHLVKLGLNYHLGRSGAPGDAVPALLQKAPPLPAWQFDVGARYWYSQGRYQNDLALTTNMAQQNHLVSRLTYESTGHSGEVFWRIDSPRRIFLKGFAGLGGLTGGHMNDEDWFPTDPGDAMAYSNTYHARVTGTIGYATLDLGADLLGDADNRIGLFVGYNFYRDRKDSFGCTQIGLPHPSSICGVPVPTTTIAISQYEDWHSLRLGINGVVTVTPGLRLAVDAAYLPYARIAALDTHHQRTEMPSPKSPAWGEGRGVQLEAILSYDVTPQFSVGVGGRYWAFWATDVLTAGFGSPTPDQALPIRAERFGTFLQGSYKFSAF
jgi:opacity protein-like surface antigen